MSFPMTMSGLDTKQILHSWHMCAIPYHCGTVVPLTASRFQVR